MNGKFLVNAEPATDISTCLLSTEAEIGQWPIILTEVSGSFLPIECRNTIIPETPLTESSTIHQPFLF